MLPEWASRIEHLRRALEVSQSALAERLKVSPMSVSRWERGVQEPSAQVFIQLGNLSSGTEKWYFWELAGLQRSEVSGVSAHSDHVVIPATEDLRRAMKKRPLVAVPLLGVEIGKHANAVTLDSPAIEVIAAPEAWCPHPNHTVCARIVDDSMAPTIPQSAIVCVDRTEQIAARLHGKLVLICNSDEGYRIARLQRRNLMEVLSPENKHFAPMSLQDGWQLEGRVLWWITRPE
jgi:transcriptional regulator with XRE-family HTH domain